MGRLRFIGIWPADELNHGRGARTEYRVSRLPSSCFGRKGENETTLRRDACGYPTGTHAPRVEPLALGELKRLSRGMRGKQLGREVERRRKMRSLRSAPQQQESASPQAVAQQASNLGTVNQRWFA